MTPELSSSHCGMTTSQLRHYDVIFGTRRASIIILRIEKALYAGLGVRIMLMKKLLSQEEGCRVHRNQQLPGFTAMDILL